VSDTVRRLALALDDADVRRVAADERYFAAVDALRAAILEQTAAHDAADRAADAVERARVDETR
jgi:hypothetical protein